MDYGGNIPIDVPGARTKRSIRHAAESSSDRAQEGRQCTLVTSLEVVVFQMCFSGTASVCYCTM